MGVLRRGRRARAGDRAPAFADLIERIRGTFLRSPSRQLYVTTFALALGLGVAVDAIARPRGRSLASGRHRAWGLVLAGVLLAAHAVDLGVHDRRFIRMVATGDGPRTSAERRLTQSIGDGRAAIDFTLPLPFNREVDDVGFFDAILLAKPYQALMDLVGAPEGSNFEEMDGSQMPPRALASTATRLVLTARLRLDLEPVDESGPVHVYRVPGSLPRAGLFPTEAALFLDEAEIHRRLRDGGHDLGRHVMLPPGDYGLSRAAEGEETGEGNVAQYRRPTSDEIVVLARVSRPSFLRVLEAWDPGWSATVNAATVDVLRSDDAFLAVALPEGEHEIRFRYSTPGARTGLVITLAALGSVLGLVTWTRRQLRSRAAAAMAGKEP